MKRRGPAQLRLGLCCPFAAEPIRFRTTMATAMLRLPRPARLARLADFCRANADALGAWLANMTRDQLVDVGQELEVRPGSKSNTECLPASA